MVNNEKEFAKALNDGVFDAWDEALTKIHPLFRITNYNLAMKAVSTDGLLLRFVAENLKNRSELTHTTVLECPDAIAYAGRSAKEDYDLAKKVLEKDPYVFEYFSSYIRGGVDICLSLLNREDHETIDYENIIPYFTDKIFNSITVMKVVAKVAPKFIVYASDALKNEIDFGANIVNRDGENIKYLSDNLKKNKAIALIAVKHKEVPILKFLPDVMRCNADVVAEAVAANDDNLAYADPEMFRDRNFLRELNDRNVNFIWAMPELSHYDSTLEGEILRAVENHNLSVYDIRNLELAKKAYAKISSKN